MKNSHSLHDVSGVQRIGDDFRDERSVISRSTVRDFADLWLLDLEARQRELLVVIEVFPKATTYVDESIRTDRESGEWMCCVTAYIGTFDSWIKAEIEWQQVLDYFGVSELHFTDFMAREAEFKNDWLDDKRNAFMERLCTIASERPIMGVGCAIRQHDWENGLEAELRDEWKDPYYFCIYGVLSLIHSYALQGRIALPLPLYFLFDNKPKFEGAALKLYREYQTAHDPNGKILGDLAFGSRKKYKPLQIADLLVGVINRRFEEMVHKIAPDSSKMKKPLDLLSKRPLATTFPMAANLKEFKDFVQRRPLHS